jgi:hypothetical protein
MAKYVVHLFITTLLTMVMIYIIKKAASKYNVPVVKTIAEGV